MAKRQMPEVGRFERGREDPFTRVTWIYVTREMAHAHPMGQLNLLLYLIILYLALLGAGKIVGWTGLAGFGLLYGAWVLAGGLLNVLTAVGLFFKVPWSVVLAIVQLIFPIVGFVRGISSDTIVWIIAEILFLIISMLYLLDGDRPNLIYRYRYRSTDVGDPSKGDGDD